MITDLPDCDKVLYLNSHFSRKLRAKGVIEALIEADQASQDGKAS